MEVKNLGACSAVFGSLNDRYWLSRNSNMSSCLTAMYHVKSVDSPNVPSRWCDVVVGREGVSSGVLHVT
ncbi:hypothetical protein TNCV_1292161 [Trichonephila clavipes]|nr:hypothetical protein TNCV_1292161 [Trichonephila clavipes]